MPRQPHIIHLLDLKQHIIKNLPIPQLPEDERERKNRQKCDKLNSSKRQPPVVHRWPTIILTHQNPFIKKVYAHAHQGDRVERGHRRSVEECHRYK